MYGYCSKQKYRFGKGRFRYKHIRFNNYKNNQVKILNSISNKNDGDHQNEEVKYYFYNGLKGKLYSYVPLIGVIEDNIHDTNYEPKTINDLNIVYYIYKEEED